MSDISLPITCHQCEAQASAFIEGSLTASERGALGAHLATCASCTALYADLRGIVAEAAKLPLLTPSRDLWNGIAERLDTPVVSIGSVRQDVRKRTPAISMRMLAAAAVLLIAASSGVTYVLARGNRAAPSVAPVAVAPAPVSPAAAQPVQPVASATGSRPLPVSEPISRGIAAAPDREGTPVRNASRNTGSIEFTYEREIAAMRRIVDERLGDLDSVTVVEIERNLNIIDKAINDSRRALENDPRSRFLNSQLDRALENKLGVLRRIALM